MDHARLTSVRQPLAGMGRMAVETVLGMAGAPGLRPGTSSWRTALTVRDSTGPGPAA